MNNISSTYDHNWFASRKLDNIDYQYRAIMETTKLINEKLVSVLAACPGAGKTLMSIYLIEQYLKANPTHKVIVFAHGQTVLREQFNRNIEKYKPNFTHNHIISKRDFDPSKQVFIGIPQTLRSVNFTKFKNVFVVVDEAHEFYEAQSVTNILSSISITRTLCLTGTPSKFIRNGTDCSFTAVCDIMDSGRIAPMTINVVCSNYKFHANPFQDNEDREGESSDIEDTNLILDEVIEGIYKLLKHHRNAKYSNLVSALPTLKKLKKTMIACNSQKQAIQVKSYFDKRGVKCELSISNVRDETPNYDAITRFVEKDEVLILIVVQRGVLGFDFDDLINVVDMTLSHNINRIYQLMSRAIRSNKAGDRKFFYKIAPSDQRTYYEEIMNAVLSMCTYDFYSMFNGKNLDIVSIPVIRNTRPRTREPKTGEEARVQRRNSVRPIPMINMDLESYIQGNYHTGKKACEVYGTATLKEVKELYLSLMTLEEIISTL